MSVRTLTRAELERLGVSVDPNTGAIYQKGEEIKPLIHLTKNGLTYPKVMVYDPLVYARTKKQGTRSILAGRLVWAFVYGVCPMEFYVKPKDGNYFNLKPENLELRPRRRV